MATLTPSATPTRKSVTGFVTKLVGDGATYGFINDEIFFQQTNVADGPASNGDRVFAECEYSEHLPIKWNATSIKIIGRASSGPAGSILESDPRRQSRQGLLNQQPAQPQSHTVTNTYQSQRASKHELPVDQPTPPSHIQQQQPPPPMVLNQQPEFFSPFVQPPPLPQSQHQELQPFQHDTPMGPPKLEYTSQLGSAFVQNQFMPSPLLPQQAPPQPLLQQHQPQQRQDQQQQHQQQRHHQQSNQRDPRAMRDSNTKGRFNDKNDRNQTNRGRNNKFESNSRSTERDNSSNNRSSRSGDTRDRSAGRNDNRGTKREESNSGSRQSPVTHSGRSTNSMSTERHKSLPRRHYDSQNIPKNKILENLNGWNIRSRCSVHVPSDLKNVIVNKHLRLDIKNTPKPISFKIEQPLVTEEPRALETEENKIPNINNEVEVVKMTTEDGDTATQSNTETKMTEKNDQVTPPSSRSDSKLYHKYGVKVILISLPELEEIYKKVFGPELDSYTNESKTQPRLEEILSLLCNKSSNGGHSLIGGKFDSTLDGFVEGETNEFERYGKQPDLISTCRRVVLDQTGLDLGPCQGWTLVATFLYNNKSDYFSSKASIEYSYIWLPHIWSMKTDSLSSTEEVKESSLVDEEAAIMQDVNIEIQSKDVARPQDGDESDPTIDTNQEEDRIPDPAEIAQKPSLTFSDISDLKVADLKAELDKRDVKYKPNAKKAELAIALQECINNTSQSATNQSKVDETTEKPSENDNKTTDEAEEKVQNDQLEEGEVTADGGANKDGGDVENHDTASARVEETYVESGKRKAEENGSHADDADEQDTKRICKEDIKSEKVDLIMEPFVIRARNDQQQLSSISLYEATQVSRYDQFELSVATSVLKEALIQHFSEYIFTALVEDHRQKYKEASDTSSTSSSVTNSQDANNSDTNNNSAANKSVSPSTAVTNQSPSDKVNFIKEYSVDRYINLAFVFFDSMHMGYVQSDDLFRLFNNTGLTISKRALWSLIGEGEKFNYRTLPDLPAKLAPNCIYRFPNQFNTLPNLSSSRDSTESRLSTSRMVEYEGATYEVAKLVQQVRDAEINRVNIVQRYNEAILKHDQREAEIHVLEISQMSLSKSIKALNAEISDLKREKLNVEKRVDSFKKQIKDAVKILNES